MAAAENEQTQVDPGGHLETSFFYSGNEEETIEEKKKKRRKRKEKKRGETKGMASLHEVGRVANAPNSCVAATRNGAKGTP